MGRTIDDVIASLPRKRQERIEARYQELKDEVESLQALRQLAGKAQGEIAAALKIKQPSVSKIEKQTDMYLSTLRGYVEALGGELELVVRLPSHRALTLKDIGDVLSPTAVPQSYKAAGRSRAKAKKRSISRRARVTA